MRDWLSSASNCPAGALVCSFAQLGGRHLFALDLQSRAVEVHAVVRVLMVALHQERLRRFAEPFHANGRVRELDLLAQLHDVVAHLPSACASGDRELLEQSGAGMLAPHRLKLRERPDLFLCLLQRLPDGGQVFRADIFLRPRSTRALPSACQATARCL